MKILFNKIFLEHYTGNHPENKNRLDAFKDYESVTFPDGEKYLGLVHNGQYIEDVKDHCDQSLPLGDGIMCSPQSYQAAINAVGATILASETGDFAVVRPPGHHAQPGKATGFCIFNNVAIAAQKLVNKGKKVLIIDFDGHFGDGTSNMFYETDKVLFWSIHQCPGFPGTGIYKNIGKGKGLGYNLNVNLPPSSGDDVFIESVNTFLPIAKSFNPDVVAVSAGFDAHKNDLLLELNLSLNSFYDIGTILRENFDNIFGVLEGGYDTDILPKGIENFVAGINNEKMPHVEERTTSDEEIIKDYRKGEKALLEMLDNLPPKIHGFSG